MDRFSLFWCCEEKKNYMNELMSKTVLRLVHPLGAPPREGGRRPSNVTTNRSFPPDQVTTPSTRRLLEPVSQAMSAASYSTSASRPENKKCDSSALTISLWRVYDEEIHLTYGGMLLRMHKSRLRFGSVVCFWQVKQYCCFNLHS